MSAEQEGYPVGLEKGCGVQEGDSRTKGFGREYITNEEELQDVLMGELGRENIFSHPSFSVLTYRSVTVIVISTTAHTPRRHIMHKELKESGLAAMYNIRPMTDNLDLAIFLGKHVRYKRELLTPEFIRSHGRIVIESIFVVKETQRDYSGKECLRIYCTDFDDSFGRVACADTLEIIG